MAIGEIFHGGEGPDQTVQIKEYKKLHKGDGDIELYDSQLGRHTDTVIQSGTPPLVGRLRHPRHVIMAGVGLKRPANQASYFAIIPYWCLVVISKDRSRNKLKEAADRIGLPTFVVADAGRTQVVAGSKTVLALGPGLLYAMNCSILFMALIVLFFLSSFGCSISTKMLL
ncbi:hypothetical protein Taro_040576 [Colocasia esculenta]|uniref:peptidyl-tRNA hydrolase n=1 Tax=Colocasia esculenta TaxID=4460 RepID=A0A843WQV0_COLES|nr:hypothetical protein [Colocasia esculenta]